MSFLWQQTGENCYSGQARELKVSCQPPRGLQLNFDRLMMPAVLGVEIVYAAELGEKPLLDEANQPEATIRQDTLLVRYAPLRERNVECDIRWRISPEGLMDLEVSALTPGRWENLGVQTCSHLPAGELLLIDDTTPPIFIYRPIGNETSYVEFCHPEDGSGLCQELHSDGAMIMRYKLFGHDLEKGVILRGRLRGQLLARRDDVAAAQAAYQRFLATPANLSL